MNSLKNIGRSRNVWYEVTARLQNSMTTTASVPPSASSSSEIKIPARIERSPTDILKALDSTVNRDPTGVHYKYIDDPFLIPYTKMDHRKYALSREAGRKAAMWIHKEHRDLFPTNIADPDIKAFKPPVVYTDESTVTEMCLMEEISYANIEDSIKIYELLKGNVSNQAKQSLLELLCFYNGVSPMSEELHETRWLQYFDEKQLSKWRDMPLINQLFDHLVEQDSATAAAAYNALISGLAKALHINKAWEMYTECLANNIPLTRETFNYILGLIPLLVQDDKKRIEDALGVCHAMSNSGIRPDTRTLNVMLRLCGFLTSQKLAQEFFSTIFSEFEKLNITPSLVSYKYAILIFGHQNSDLSMFIDILRKIKDKEFTIQDPKDVTFFATAMQLACNVYCSREAGELIYDILLTGDNYQFIANNYNEQLFYRYYLQLILATETIQEFFAIYDKLVPQIYIPEPTVLMNIVNTLEPYPPEVIVEYLPHLWSQLVTFNFLERANVVAGLFKLMRAKCNLQADSPLHKLFAEAAWTYWTFLQSIDSRRIQTKSITAEVTGDMAILLLRDGRLDEFIEVLQSPITKPNLVVGVLTNECVNEVFNICITHGYEDEAFAILHYMVQANFEDIGDKAKRIYDNFSLSNERKNKLIELVGAEVLELNSPEN